jgi:23S rRNA (uracil1939-C5)-methyltransferase
LLIIKILCEAKAEKGRSQVEQIQVEITALGSEGQGIGALPSGKTCFVSGVFPGEVCLCELENETSKYAVCNAAELLTASPDRTAPFRPADEVCGGLPFAALSYEAQLKFKQTRVRDCLARIGGFDEALLNEVFKPITGADAPFRYRNHMQYAVRDNVVGLLCAKSDKLGDYDGKLIEYEIFGMIKDMAYECVDRAPTRLFDGLIVRGSLRTKQILVEFVSTLDGPHEVIIRDAERYFETTHLFDNICNTCEENGYVLNGFLFRISPTKSSKRTRTGVRTIYSGVDYYDEIFCGRRFRVKAGSFFQVNTEQAEKLANKASEACSDAKVIYDLYCGCGTLGLAVKQKGQKLLGIEVVPEAIQSAKINRSLALNEQEAGECEFICKDVLKADFTQLIKSGKILPPDCIIVDPPRKGLDIGVVKKVVELGAPKICYISCDPATLARDLKMISREYKIEEVTPVDLFPNASHVETVVLMTKKA